MEVNRINSPVSVAAMAPQQNDQKLQTTPEMAQAVAAVNAAKLFGQDSELTFAMDRETRQTIIRLVDRKTRKVIQEIPPKNVMSLAENLVSPAG